MSQNHQISRRKSRSHSKIRFYGSRLAPIDVFSNLNPEYIIHTSSKNQNNHNSQNSNHNLPLSGGNIQLKSINRHTSLKKKKEKHDEGKGKPETRVLSALERRDQLVDEFFSYLKNNSKELFDICEALVISSSVYTSLAFIVSEKPEVQLTREAFSGVIANELPNYDQENLRELFDYLDVERLGLINIHQLVSLMNFSRLHRGSSIDEILRAVLEGIIWECAVLEQNRPPSQKGGRHVPPITTYMGARAMLSFEIYKKHPKKKELLDSYLRTPIPFPSIITALRTVCPKGGHRSRQRPTTSNDSHPLRLSSPAGGSANAPTVHLPPDEPDSIDSFLCRLYECGLNAAMQTHPSYHRHSSFKLFESPQQQQQDKNEGSKGNSTFPLNLSPGKKNSTSPHIRFAVDENQKDVDENPEIFRQPSSGFDEMITSPQFKSMKVTLDDISVFVSTQPEIQSRLRAELIDQSGRHDHNIVTRRVRTTTTNHGNGNGTGS